MAVLPGRAPRYRAAFCRLVSGLRLLPLALGLLSASQLTAQVDPGHVTFEQAVVLQTTRFEGQLDGSTTFTPVSTRQATIEELHGAVLLDADGDGIPGLLDACPELADCGRPDGSFEELRGPGAKSDFMTPYLVRFASATELANTVLVQNGAHVPPLYPPEQLIQIGADAGFPTATVATWFRSYSCGETARSACRQVCHQRCPAPDTPRSKADGRGHCLGDCLAECAKIAPQCREPKGRAR